MCCRPAYPAVRQNNNFKIKVECGPAWLNKIDESAQYSNSYCTRMFQSDILLLIKSGSTGSTRRLSLKVDIIFTSWIPAAVVSYVVNNNNPLWVPNRSRGLPLSLILLFAGKNYMCRGAEYGTVSTPPLATTTAPPSRR